MKNYDLYARLELITSDFEATHSEQNSSIHQLWIRSKTRLQQAAQSFLKYCVGSSEPTIAARRDRQGNQYFTAYDPVDGRHHSFASELELRVWLEQRYYQ